MNNTDILLPSRRIHQRTATILIVLLSSWLLAISAQVSINLPFSPVPVTAQTLLILVMGYLLGKNRGSAAVLAYLVQGAAGLPFFANGRSGISALVGPTGGYLFGFLAAVYIVGLLSELDHRRSLLQRAVTLMLGNLFIYGFGLLWLARFVGETQVLQVGFFPFLTGDLLKIAIALAVITGLNSYQSAEQNQKIRGV